MGRRGSPTICRAISGFSWSICTKKRAKDFVPEGTTQNQFKASVVKRFGKEVELNAWVQYEGWKAPAYKPGLQKDTSVAVQLTWYPKLQQLSGSALALSSRA